MDDRELISKIREIVYAVPDKLYNIPKPDKYWDDDAWATMSSEEKGFVLLRQLFEEESRTLDEYKIPTDDLSEVSALELGKGPRFWSNADEDMFFTALRSISSFVDVRGEHVNLILYHRGKLANEEKLFLKGLLKRYGMKIPPGLE